MAIARDRTGLSGGERKRLRSSGYQVAQVKKDYSQEYSKFVKREATAAQRRNEAAQGVSTIPVDPQEKD